MNYLLYLGTIVTGSIILCLAVWRKHWSAFGFVVVLTGISRFIPAASSGMWFGEDHYWYWLSTKAIIQTGHITAELGSLNGRSITVMFNILAAVIRVITGVTNTELLHTYVPLILVPGFLLGGLLILVQVLPTYQALIGGYLYIMLDVTINESLTFTQFGFFSAISLFFFVAYYLNTHLDNWPQVVLTLTFAGATALSHVMASIVFAVWIPTHNIIFGIYNRIPTPNLPWRLRLKTIYMSIFILIFMSSIQIFVLTDFFRSEFLTVIQYSNQATGAGVAETSSKSYGLLLLNQGTLITKVIIVGGSVFTFVTHLRGNLSDNSEKLATLAVVALVVSTVGYFVNPAVLGRILMFSYIFLLGSLLVGIRNWTHSQATYKLTVVILVVSLVVLNVPAGFPPSYIDKDIDINDDGYHQVTPIEKEGPVAGQWLAQYYDSSQPIAVGTHYSPIVFYYGETGRIRFNHITNPFSGTVLIDPKRGRTVRFESVRYYDNGRVTFQMGQKMMIISERNNG